MQMIKAKEVPLCSMWSHPHYLSVLYDISSK